MVESTPDTYIIKFSAKWCGPCKAVAPVVDRVAADTSVHVVHVDVDAQPELAAQYGVRSIPAMFAVRGGQVVGSIIGARGEPDIRALFDKLTANTAE